jgi:hypothetical protein
MDFGLIPRKFVRGSASCHNKYNTDHDEWEVKVIQGNSTYFSGLKTIKALKKFNHKGTRRRMKEGRIGACGILCAPLCLVFPSKSV